MHRIARSCSQLDLFRQAKLLILESTVRWTLETPSQCHRLDFPLCLCFYCENFRGTYKARGTYRCVFSSQPSRIRTGQESDMEVGRGEDLPRILQESRMKIGLEDTIDKIFEIRYRRYFQAIGSNENSGAEEWRSTWPSRVVDLS